MPQIWLIFLSICSPSRKEGSYSSSIHASGSFCAVLTKPIVKKVLNLEIQFLQSWNVKIQTKVVWYDKGHNTSWKVVSLVHTNKKLVWMTKLTLFCIILCTKLADRRDENDMQRHWKFEAHIWWCKTWVES